MSMGVIVCGFECVGVLSIQYTHAKYVGCVPKQPGSFLGEHTILSQGQ